MIDYPRIEHIDDLLPHVQHLEEIGVTDKGLFTVISYNVAFPDTFATAHARECRGIIFCNETGRVISRPFHKFFNVNEKAHTQEPLLSQKYKIVEVMDKIDGALIRPVVTSDGKLHFFTKRCSEDFATHLAGHPLVLDQQFREMCRAACAADITLLFEFYDPEFAQSNIVLRYPEARLTMLAARHNISGNYAMHDWQKFSGYKDIVNSYEVTSETSLLNLATGLSAMEDREGYVIRLYDFDNDDELFVKMKTPWYVKRHKAKEMFNHPHITAQLILDCHDELSIDDIIGNFDDKDREYFEAQSRELHQHIDLAVDWIQKSGKLYESKKNIAMSPLRDNPLCGLLFRAYGNTDDRGHVFNLVVDDVKRNRLGKQIRFYEWKCRVLEATADDRIEAAKKELGWNE